MSQARALSLTAFLTLLLIGLMMGANHVAARVAFGSGLDVATAVAVQCESLRQTWRIDGGWQPWQTPVPGSVGQRIVVDLCSNTLDSPALPVPPPMTGTPYL